MAKKQTTVQKSIPLGFEVNEKDVLKHLNFDFFDEWYFDCLNYKDLIKDPNQIHMMIEQLVQADLGQYPSQKRIVRNIPKKGLPVRYSLETDFYDRFVYQAICTFLVPFFDSQLSHRVLSHRYAGANTKRYLFQNRIENWRTFEGVTKTFVREKKCLLVTDLANYFENIQVPEIIAALDRKLASVTGNASQKRQIRSAITTLEKCLLNWSFSGNFGLPQNRDASTFLANLVVTEIDEKMVKLGYDYYRYVDDIRVICSDTSEAKKALMDLIGCLREQGLNINSAKTEILEHSSSAKKIAEYFPHQDPRVSAIHQMWRSRSKPVVLKSIKHLIKLLQDCIRKGQTQSRQFRFAANRLAQLSDAGVLSHEQLDGEALQAALVDALLEQPVTTDQFCKILDLLGLNEKSLADIEAFLCNRQLAIHDWQNYHLWILLAKNSIKSDKLRKVALDEIERDFSTAETAAMLIWADQVKYKSILNKAIKCFSADLPYQTQRYFAIATRDIPPNRLKPVFGKISGRVTGTKDRLSSLLDENGKLIFPRRETPIERLFDEVSEYD